MVWGDTQWNQKVFHWILPPAVTSHSLKTTEQNPLSDYVLPKLVPYNVPNENQKYLWLLRVRFSNRHLPEANCSQVLRVNHVLLRAYFLSLIRFLNDICLVLLWSYFSKTSKSTARWLSFFESNEALFWDQFHNCVPCPINMSCVLS